jgi:colanic acid/amylovoran biosynthesis glycosyltransferase
VTSDAAEEPRRLRLVERPQQRKVALFSTTFLRPHEAFIYEQIQNHDRYQVEVFADQRLGEEQFPFEPVHVHRSGQDESSAVDRVESLLYRLTTLSPRFDRALSRGKFSLIHAHFGPGGIYALGYAVRHKLPLVVLFHGYDVPALMGSTRFRPAHWRYTLLHKSLFRRSTLLLAASKELRELLLSIGAPPESCRVWRLGVGIPEMRLPMRVRRRGPLHIVMVGQFVEKKGFEYGLRAAGALQRSGVEVDVTLIGAGDREPLYHKAAYEEGISARVAITGFLPHDQTLRRIADADVVLSPSVVASDGDRDSGVIVLKEASARCVPVIGTVHGGIPDIIEDGVTGFLVPERDVELLTSRLRHLARNPGQRLQLGHAGRAKMEKEYDVKARVAELETLYDEAIALAAARGSG